MTAPRSGGSGSGESRSPASRDVAETTPVGEPPIEVPRAVGIGQVLGRYVVLEVLGRGAMGEVLRAYDPKLRRELAVKRIVATSLPADAEARLVREAQAMAQLGHPNVVSVYDVDVTDRGVLVAMEYVRGTTLEAWLKQRPDWRRILEVFVQAGRGLQAAHACGLVHRDFKPANVLVAEDGRVRVADFGLVKVTDPDRSSLDGPEDVAFDSVTSWSSLDGLDPKLTEADVVLGTPRYMAPEQHGGPVLAPSDQYAFCVALWEALVGEPPFRGNLEDLVRGKLRGPPTWPRRIAIPRRIVAAIERGMSPRPGDRFPSMEALVAELERSASSRRLALGAGALVVLVGALGVVALQARAPDKCSGAQALLDASWGDEQRARVQQAFAATEIQSADAAWSLVADRLDAYAGNWASQHREACEATTVRGEQSERVMDLRMGCLGRARGELQAIVGVFEQADAKTVERSLRLLESLPRLEGCEDVAALEDDVAPPPEGPIADAVAAAREDLARSRALYRIGKYEESLALADAVDARVRELDYPPIHAEAALGRGDVLDYLGRYDDSEAALRRALQIALREGSLDVAIKAATSLVYVVGKYLGRPEEAQWPARLGLDLSQRIRADPVLVARARNAMGEAHRLESRWQEAEAEYRGAIEDLARAVGENDSRVATVRAAFGALLTEAGEYARAEPETRRALEVRRSLLGASHPDVALASEALSYTLVRLGRFQEAEVLLREAIEVRTAAHGPDHLFTAAARGQLAYALAHDGRARDALKEAEAAVASLEATMPPDHPGFIEVLHHDAFALERLGRLEDAEAVARRGLRIAETAYGASHPAVAEELDHVAHVLAERGLLEEAEGLARRAVDVLERTRGSEHAVTMNARATLGEILLARGELAGARTVLERVWTFLDQAAVAPHARGQAAFALARALTGDPAGSARASTLARRAEDEYRAAGPGFAAELAEVVRWRGQTP